MGGVFFGGENLHDECFRAESTGEKGGSMEVLVEARKVSDAFCSFTVIHWGFRGLTSSRC